MLKLEIPNDILEQIIRYAREQAPVEACGLLAGKEGAIEKFYRMSNLDRSSDHFTMAPEEQFQAAKDIRAAGLEMLAIFHSHPASPARPSQEDIRLAFTPGVVQVIVSLENTEPVVKGFLIEDGQASEVALDIRES